MSNMYRNNDTDNDGWEYAWLQRQPEIDNRIVACLENARDQSAETLNRLESELGDWFESQQLSGQASAELKRIRANGKILQTRIEQRIAHLVADGKLKLTRWKSEQHDSVTGTPRPRY